MVSYKERHNGRYSPGKRVDQFRDQLKEGSIYTTKKFDWYDRRKSYRSVDHSLRIFFTMRTTLSEVVPPPENFPMYAYTAVPFSMLSDCIDWNILISDLQQISDGLTKSPMFCLLLVIQRAKSDKFISRMAASMLLLLCRERC